jgi:HK97 family phage portal protein
VSVTDETALRHSAVWACRRLRANLISTFPVDVYRKVAGLQVEMPKSPILVEPGGKEWDYVDWMWATQWDLDGAGNTIGLITEQNALGLPARIDLQDINTCQVIRRKWTNKLDYRIDGRIYQPEQVWHERQYRVAGLDVGLSPIAYAAWSIGEYLSAQQFALDWFAGAGVPKARMRNKEKQLKPKETATIKERYNASVSNGDLFVYGADWEYDFMQAEAMGMEWLESRRFGLADICRFLDCPADLIDAAISAPGTLTYASITQRNLQFLIMGLGLAVVRREKNLSKLLPAPRFVKLNTDALLRMDPKTRGEVLDAAIKSRRMTVTEARAKDNLPPLTPEQEEEFARLFGAPRTNPTPADPPVTKANTEALMMMDELEPLRVFADTTRRALPSGEQSDWDSEVPW